MEDEFEYDEGSTPARHAELPHSLLDYILLSLPVLKYYVLLLALYLLARWLSRPPKEPEAPKVRQERPVLSEDLLRDSSSEGEKDDEEEEEEQIYEELVTDGSRLVKMPQNASTKTASKVTQRKVKIKKTTTSKTTQAAGSSASAASAAAADAAKKKKNKNHPLFEGLQKIEEELREEEKNHTAENVSWNELHRAMLKRYQDKFPDHGLRVQQDDDYDDEFKELLKKHNINLADLKKKQ